MASSLLFFCRVLCLLVGKFGLQKVGCLGLNLAEPHRLDCGVGHCFVTGDFCLLSAWRLVLIKGNFISTYLLVSRISSLGFNQPGAGFGEVPILLGFLPLGSHFESLIVTVHCLIVLAKHKQGVTLIVVRFGG